MSLCENGCCAVSIGLRKSVRARNRVRLVPLLLLDDFMHVGQTALHFALY
jgi:hypothetical protein